MALNTKIFEQTGFGFVFQIQKFVLSTIVNIIIINALPRDQYGVIGLVAGYFVFISWFLVTPESILLQQFKERRENDFALYVSKVFSFMVIRTIFLLVLAAIFAGILFWSQKSLLVSFAMIMYAAAQLLLSASGSLQFILKIDFQQKTITKWATIFKIVEVLMLSLLFLASNLFVYLLLIIALAFFEVCMWMLLLRREHNVQLWLPVATFMPTIKKDITTYSLWQHITQNLTKYMYEIDTVFLGMWASLTVVGNYSVALKVANFSFILPSIIQTSTMLALTRLTNPLNQNRAVNLFLKYAFFISTGQVIGFLLVGKWYIRLHTPLYVDEIFRYTILILIGTMIINIVRPLISYVLTQSDIKKFLLQSVLPSAVISTILYVVGSYWYGATGVAAMNIASYLFWALTIVWYLRRTSFAFHFILFDEKEKEIVFTVFDRLVAITTRFKK